MIIIILFYYYFIILNFIFIHVLHCTQIDSDKSGYIDARELGKALEAVGIRLPGYEVRQLVSSSDSGVRDGKIDIEEFKNLYTELKMKFDMKDKWKQFIVTRDNVKTIPQASTTSTATHSVTDEECVAYSNFINGNFSDDPDCRKYLPINPNTDDLYQKINDGILLCKMINFSQPDTIIETAINKHQELTVYQKLENQMLVLRSAQAIGCSIINIGPEDLCAGRHHLVLGLIWQIIRIGLLADINLQTNPHLVALLLEGESLEDFMKLSPEEILIRWVNYHLARSGCGRKIHNFTTDIKDSIAYIHLLNQIAPEDAGVTIAPERESNLEARAEKMLNEADKINCRAFISAKDVVRGFYRLNLAFVANLFNKHPKLEPVEMVIPEIVETREEKTYRNWMNSLGVNPFVYHFYSDLSDGLILLQLFDIIKHECVNWDKVVKEFKSNRAMMEKIGNCNYAVELGKECKFTLVGISGKNIHDGDKTHVLALVWQMMRVYTLSILSHIKQSKEGANIDKEIVAWANEKLKEAGKSRSITGFNDKNLTTGKAVIDLVDAISPGSINYSHVKDADTDEEKLENAKYGICVARRNGARIYALPEDIVEVKPKMVMTIFACLMILDLEKRGKQ
ncbi:hypothetical protein HELRODRAFT_82785 [Helobdella robusta]|uniref:Fimbrin n=1 Tax=Helobdella robusta TaxID=6412 RepID=T1G4W6_HELRO|nr:hypothetical protein HELRODRAFT_82785 [Helobdella robusta]ESO00625.1 hypothetical protein HELRODRAFT_82785 [Helobdella robusta]